MSDDDLPVPVAVLVIAAIVGAIFLGIAIALCCYFCVPYCKRSRTAPLGSHYQTFSDDNCCIRCCYGNDFRVSTQELRQGYANIDPYVIPIGEQRVVERQPGCCQPGGTCGDCGYCCGPCYRCLNLCSDDDSPGGCNCFRSSCCFRESYGFEGCGNCTPCCQGCGGSGTCDDCGTCDEDCSTCCKCSDPCCDPGTCGGTCCACLATPCVCSPCCLPGVAPQPQMTRLQPEVVRREQPRQIAPPPPAIIPDTDLRFTKYLKSVTLANTPQKVILDCELNKPNIDVFWTKNDRPIDIRRVKIEAKGTHHQMTIANCEPNDEGTYQCAVVSHPNGTLATSADINVKTPPKLMIDKYLNKTIETKVGQTVYFNLPFSGHPRPTIKVTKDGKALPDRSRMSVNHVGTDPIAIFTVEDSIRSDSGTYLVTAENPSGKTEGKLLLAVKDRPSIPRDFYAAETLSTSSKVNWLKPSDDGGSPVEGYVIEKKDSKGNWQSVSKYASSVESTAISKLESNTTHSIRVAAFNKFGTSDWNYVDIVTKPLPTTVTVPQKPDPPHIDKVTSNNCEINWRPPAWDGGSPLTKYHVEKSEAGFNKWYPVAVANRDPLPLSSQSGTVETNKKYQFRVAAENAVGIGPFSDPSVPVLVKNQFDPPGKPKRPQISEVSPSKCRVDWTPPESDGGAPITKYHVQRSDAGTKNWQPLFDVPAGTLSRPVENLDQNVKHQFRVAAENKAGMGPFSDPSDPVNVEDPRRPPSKPDKPKISDISKGNLKVNWESPKSDGGAPITQYRIQHSDDNNKNWNPTPGVPVTPKVPLSIPIQDLDPAINHQFRVAAENEVGTGPYSDPSSPVKPQNQFKPPGKPRQPTVSNVSHSKCTVGWDPPASDGGAPITQYQLQMDNGSKWQPIGEIPAKPNKSMSMPLNNLDPAKQHRFKVAAENEAGLGPYSDPSEPVVCENPWKPPGKPDRPVVSDVAMSKCNVNWKPPRSDGGAPITQYHIQKNESGSSKWEPFAEVPGNQRNSLPATGLNPNKKHQFRVAAENKAGRGPFSDPSEPVAPVDPRKVPDRPGRPLVKDIGGNTANVNWKQPKSDGGAPITDYIVDVIPSNNKGKGRKVHTDAPTTTANIPNLPPGDSYKVQVTAVNEKGKSQPSEPSSPLHLPKSVERNVRSVFPQPRNRPVEPIIEKPNKVVPRKTVKPKRIAPPPVVAKPPSERTPRNLPPRYPQLPPIRQRVPKIPPPKRRRVPQASRKTWPRTRYRNFPPIPLKPMQRYPIRPVTTRRIPKTPPHYHRIAEWDRFPDIRTPPRKYRKDRLDRLWEERPPFNLSTGIALNSLNRHDIQRKVTEF